MTLGQPIILEHAGQPCKVCGGLHDEVSMMLCDRCEGCFHPECLSPEAYEKIRDGPWLCEPCRGHVALHGATDITHDFGLLDYLFDGTIPGNPEEYARIQKLATMFRAYGAELQRKLPQLPGLPGPNRWATVPPIS